MTTSHEQLAYQLADEAQLQIVDLDTFLALVAEAITEDDTTEDAMRSVLDGIAEGEIDSDCVTS